MATDCSNQSCKCEIHKGDVGTNLDVELSDCGVEVLVQDTDGVEYLLRKPDGQVIRRTGVVVSAPSSTVRYTTVPDDLDQAGRWHLQLDLNIASQAWDGHSCKIPFDVVDVLEE